MKRLQENEESERLVMKFNQTPADSVVQFYQMMDRQAQAVGQENLMRINKSKCGSYTWVIATFTINTSWWMKGFSTACWKELEGTDGWKAGHETAVCPCNPQSQPGQQVESGDLAPVLCSDEISEGVTVRNNGTDPLAVSAVVG